MAEKILVIEPDTTSSGASSAVDLSKPNQTTLVLNKFVEVGGKIIVTSVGHRRMMNFLQRSGFDVVEDHSFSAMIADLHAGQQEWRQFLGERGYNLLSLSDLSILSLFVKPVPKTNSAWVRSTYWKSGFWPGGPERMISTHLAFASLLGVVGSILQNEWDSAIAADKEYSEAILQEVVEAVRVI